MSLFKGLSPLKGELTKSEIKDNSVLDLNGNVTLTRGGLSVRVNFYGRVCESRYKGFFIFEDYDWDTDVQSLTIGKIPVDNVHDFIKTLRSSGLITLADSFELNRDEIKQNIFETLEEMPRVKKFFGKGWKSFDALPINEQLKMRLDWVIENYNTCGSYMINGFGIELLEGNTQATLEQLIEYRSKL
jgi:hypothetical protein